MKKFQTRKAMIAEAGRLGAKDITNADPSFCYNLNVVDQSLTFGMYGMNGGLFRDANDNYYYITSRSTNLFILA